MRWRRRSSAPLIAPLGLPPAGLQPLPPPLRPDYLPPVRSGGSFRVLLDRLLVKSLLGIQGTHKAAAAFLQEGEGGAWTDSVETLLACGQAL